MNISESANFLIKGRFSIVNSRGDTILSKDNLVVRSAKTIIASALAGSPSADFISYVSFGDDNTSPVVSDTGLGNQVAQAEVSFQTQPTPFFEDKKESDGSITNSSDVTFSGIIASEKAFTAREAGLFSFKEFMFSRITFSNVVKSSGDPWLVSWKLKMEL